MKIKGILTEAAIAAFGLLSCQPEKEPVGGNTLHMSEISVPEELNVPGTLDFTLTVTDETVDLSTLEVSVSLGGTDILASKSIRTPGRESHIEESLDIPFAAGMEDGSKLVAAFEAINVDGEKVKKIEQVRLVRPQLPETLYMTIGETVLELVRDSGNPSLYVSTEGDYESIAGAVISTDPDLSEAEFIWGASGKDNVGAICGFSEVEEISVSYPSVLVRRYTFDVIDFTVGAEGVELSVSVNGTRLEAAAGMLYASVEFVKDAEVEISGIENLGDAWNRDFFSRAEDGKLTFLRESGVYDVYFSPRYNYIWIVKGEAVDPECLWIIGHGFTSAPVWHEDFGYGGWESSPVTRTGYAVKTDAGIYQASLFLSDRHEWASFEFEIYSDRSEEPGKNHTFESLSGFTKGIRLSGASDGKPGLTSDTGFQPGYYTIVFDTNKSEIILDRISEWEDKGGSGIFINGTELEVTDEYDFANIYFESGTSVQVSGVGLSMLNRDFFHVDGDNVTFAGVSGTYRVQYFPKYEYIWLTNEEMTFPNCLYILGCGKWSAPVFDKTASWDIDGWTRSAPMMVVAPKIAEDTWTATMSMSTDNANWRVQCELYSDLAWGQEGVTPVSLTGDAAAGFVLEGNCINGIDEKEAPFEEGCYEFIFTKADGGLSVNVRKIG